MLRASLKSLLARKLRLLMSAMAIVLGVAFVAGSLIFTDMLGSAFNGIMNGAYADVNVQSKGATDGDGFSTVRRELTPADIQRIRGVEGVASAYGSTGVANAYLIDRSNKVMAPLGAPAIGTNWIDAPAFGGAKGLVVVSGRAPSAAGEVAIDPTSLTKSGYRLGDTITIATASPTQPTVKAQIVGTALYGAKNSSAGATYALFSPAYTQQLFSQGRNVWETVWVTAAPGVEPQELARRLAPVVPGDFEAVTGADLAQKSQDAISRGLGFLSTFLLVFAGVALLVGSFLIVNTFSILVAQRSRELALLRAMGASKAQVRRSVLFEAFVIGLVGSTVGIGVGFGLARLIASVMGTVGLELGDVGFTLAPRTVLASYSVGLIVTLVASNLPARRAASVPPVAAMSGDVLSGKSDLGRRTVIGLTLTVAGIAALMAGLFLDVPRPLYWVGAGALFTLLGVAGVTPVLGAPVVWAIGRIYRRLFGEVGKLAELNAVRNPRRTAATASALMIGLTLVTASAALAATTKASTEVLVNDAMRSDYVVQNAGFGDFSTAIGDRMAGVPGVGELHRQRVAFGQLNGETVFVSAMAPDGFNRIVAQKLESGSVSDFRRGTVMLDQGYASEKGRRVGDTLTVTLNGRDVPLTVAAVFSTDPGVGVGQIVTTLDTLASAGLPAADSTLAITAAAGADRTALRAGLDAVVKDLPMVSVKDRTEYAAAQGASLDQFLTVIYALLGLAIVIAVLGIINTLALSVLERTREIGLLRAVGLKAGELRQMIRLESVVIALLGSVVGLGLGTLFGWALQRALADEGLTELRIPLGQLGAFLVAAVVVGVLAALWPAYRAGRMNVLTAIHAE
jgi:putative ABC transport system permease protein